MNDPGLVERIRDTFPQELLELDQWVTWRRVQRGERVTKTPFTPAGTLASSTDPGTWSPFDQAARAYDAGGYDGLGFVFSEHDPYTGIDFDAHSEGGRLDDWALERVNRLDSYCEWSPSGAGVHVIARAALPGSGRNDRGLGLEVYDRGRFFTITGRPLEGRNWTTIPQRQEAVDWLYAQFPARKAPEPSTVGAPAQPVDLDDAALFDRILASKQGDTFRRLWAGDTSGHGGDTSAADLALCNLLAFWTGKDPERMDRIFRQSGLFRDKWDRNARAGETYGAGTIRMAIDGTSDTFQLPTAAPAIQWPTNGHASSNGNGTAHASSNGADEDAPRLKISEVIARDLRAWGYALWLNDMSDDVWNGDKRVDDAARAVMRMRARDAGYGKAKLLGALDDAVLAIAAQNRRHPVREYLGALEWDGRDHIALLASFFTVKPTVDDAGREVPAEPITYDDGTQRTVFHAFLRRWLVGSVAKMHGDTNAARDNFILVLASDQGNGKSHFAHWLCPMPGYFVERHIVPDDKDCSLQRTRAWIWEVMEIGATTSKANTEALKAHITTAEVTERKAYGHFDTVKPAVASYIGTVNPDGAGFLNDRTGNRRFAVVELEGINWEYANVVEVRDVWAQAMALWRAEPTAYKLTDAEVERRDATAARHLAISAVEDALLHVYDIDPEQDTWRVKPAEVMSKLRMFGGLSGGSDNVVARDVARVLKNLGIEKKSYGPAKFYGGLRLKSEYSTGIQ